MTSTLPSNSTEKKCTYLNMYVCVSMYVCLSRGKRGEGRSEDGKTNRVNLGKGTKDVPCIILATFLSL